MKNLLAHFRGKRDFNPEYYLDEKLYLLNDYCQENNITTVIVGVSGGIDSAVVLGMLKRASEKPYSVIKRVIGVLIPIYGEGTSNQNVATIRGMDACIAFGSEIWNVNLTETLKAMKHSMGNIPNPFADGQVSSYLRTPALYYISALTQRDSMSVVVGTTNKSEGAYLGFYGKASDGMVDIQLISDIYKSEVYALGTLLGVPQSIIDSTPSGDVYDCRCDTQMIGATYDEIELHHSLKEDMQYLSTYDQETAWEIFFEGHPELEVPFKNIEALHKKNAHKYLVGSPAIHFTLMYTHV